MDDKKVLLSINDLWVKFQVRGRQLTAIRGISLDIYENECIAIVGESGSGKSVFTKTFAGMLDSNGYVSNGTIIFNDDELAECHAANDEHIRTVIDGFHKRLNEAARHEPGAATWRELQELESAERRRGEINSGESAAMEAEIDELCSAIVGLKNQQQTLDSRTEREQLRASKAAIAADKRRLKELKNRMVAEQRAATAEAKKDTAAREAYLAKRSELTERYNREISAEITPETDERNLVLAKEVYLSVARFSHRKRTKLGEQLINALSDAMKMGIDLNDEQQRSALFDPIAFRVRYLDETETDMHGRCVLNLANIKDADDWCKIRGCKIATVFQDPMTSLNPIITIGKQISSIIMKHQNVSEAEARSRALVLMGKVGIPNPAARYDDYPFQYSGGMRQRIVIAIALSCQPKILICDEPTTALDVTIQAQILRLIKDLQKEFGFTTVFITHDLGVVANVSDRVAVLYAGQMVELGTVKEIFYDPRHPYTWALLSSLPQLAERNTTLYSITGTPPSLYNEIKGDAFAPRNPYCLKIDTMAEPPMMKVSDTHYAKTWLLHPDAPKLEKPEGIKDIHSKLMKAFNISEGNV